MGILDYFRSDSNREDTFERSSSSAGSKLKGNEDRDPLAAMKPTQPEELTNEAALDIYEGNLFARTIVDNISEDMVRAGWEFESESDSLNETINDQLDELEVQDKVQSMIEDDLIYGDGYIGLGLTENDLDISEPVEPENIQEVEFLTDYDNEDITDHVVNRGTEEGGIESQKNYGRIERYRVEGLSKDVHRDRMLHLQMRPRKDDDEGMSFYLDKMLVVKVFGSALWSVGQLLYQPVFKAIYTDLSEMSDEEIKEMRNRLETDLNVLTAFIMHKGDGETPRDEIEFPSTSQSLSGISDMLDFVKDVMSMAGKQPLSRLFGNQAGAISGAEEDTRGYYDRISGLQQSYLKSLLRKLTGYMLWAEGQDPEQLEWSINFNSLWEYDEQTQAEIDLSRSKYWLNLFKAGAVAGNGIAEAEGLDQSATDQSLPDSFDLPEGEDAED